MFISATRRGLEFCGTVDGVLSMEDCIVLVDWSLDGDSKAGFFGIGGAGFRFVPEVEDVTDAKLGDLGFRETLKAGSPAG